MKPKFPILCILLGSSYPAQCIYSMIQEEVIDVDTIVYDVIIFEFSINGMQAFQLLHQRLKERFPNALMIHVDLYSLRSGQFGSTKSRKIVQAGGGHVLYVPRSNSTGLHDFPMEGYSLGEIGGFFTPDRHHLSSDGHALVAQKIVRIIAEFGYSMIKNDHETSQSSLGSWLGGDKCKS